MYLRDLLRSLARRWYFLLFGILLSAGLSVVAYQVVPASYHSAASVVLLPPRLTTDAEWNPFLQLGGLNQAVDILTRAVNSDANSKPLLKTNKGATFTIAPDTTTSGPIIIVTSTAPSGARATSMTADVLKAIPDTLNQIQSDLSVPQRSKITLMTIAVDSKPTLDAKNRTQAVLGIGAAGLALTILLIGLIDGLLQSRKRRQREREEDKADAADSSADETDTMTDEHRAAGALVHDEQLKAKRATASGAYPRGRRPESAPRKRD